MTLLQHHLLALGLIATTAIALGLFMAVKGPKKFLDRIFVLYLLSVAWWGSTELWSQFSPDEATAVIRLRSEYFGVCFMPTLFYHGVLTITEIRRRSELFAYYLISIVFVVLIGILRHPLFLPDAAPFFYLPYWGKAGPLYFLFVSFFTAVVFRAHQTLWRSLRTNRSTLRNTQLRLFLVFSVLAYLGGIPEFALKYGIHIPGINPYGLYLVPLHIILIAYAIVQFKLFDINIVIRRSLVYSLLVSILTVGYFSLVYLTEQTFKTTLGYQSTRISLLSFAIMALAFQPLKVSIQRFVNWIIFRVPQEELVKQVERLEEQAIQSEKFKAASTLAAGMAHEIKNPLTALKTFTEFIPEKQNDPVFLRKLYEVYTSETKRIYEIVRDILDFAKPKDPKTRSIDPESLIKSTVDLLSGEMLKRGIKWETNCQHNGHKVQADPDQLRQVLINLIQNAADAMPNGGKMTITTQPVNGYLELTVADTGEGIPKNLLPKVFDPFVTTKEGGNGLGLAMTYSIIRANRGSIRAENLPERGSAFTVSFPT